MRGTPLRSRMHWFSASIVAVTVVGLLACFALLIQRTEGNERRVGGGRILTPFRRSNLDPLWGGFRHFHV